MVITSCGTNDYRTESAEESKPIETYTPELNVEETFYILEESYNPDEFGVTSVNQQNLEKTKFKGLQSSSLVSPLFEFDDTSENHNWMTERNTVEVTNLIDIIFDLENFEGCQFPKQIKKLVEKNATLDIPGLKPTDLFDSFEVEVVNSESISPSLHIVNYFEATSDTRRSVQLDNAPTYDNLPLGLLIDTQANTIYYNIDCSGYMNLNLSSFLKGGGAIKLKGETTTGFDKAFSLTIVRARVNSPIVAAINSKFSPEINLGVLYQLLVKSNGMDDNTLIEVVSRNNMLWLSKSSEKISNGKVDLNGKLSARLPFFGLNASSGLGMDINMQTSYSIFESYVEPVSNGFENIESYSISEVKKALEKTFSRLRPKRVFRSRPNQFSFELGLPHRFVNFSWEVEEEGFEFRNIDYYNSDSYVFNVTIADNQRIESPYVTLVAKDSGINYKLKVYIDTVIF
ncbi:MAG: hypothetical protein Roseis2KO_07120 [Roseivirga sp.]